MTNNKSVEFYDYFKKIMTREEILNIFALNNIIIEKCELYNDFIESLYDLIFDTYLGDDLLKEEDQKNHFKWCWDNTVLNFSKEGVNINNIHLYKYFKTFTMQVYYSVPKEFVNTQNIIKLWQYIFNYHNTKSKSDLDVLIEVYKMFEFGIEIK